MVRYKTEPGEKEQKILAEISLNTPNNLKRRKVTSVVSAVLCVIYAAFAVWMFVRGVVDNGFLLLGFAVLFLLIILFSKKFQLSIMQKVMKKKNNAVLGGTFEYVIDDDGVAITSPLGTGKNNWSAFDRWGEQDGYIYLVRLDNNVVLMDKSRLTPDELKELERLLENVKNEPDWKNFPTSRLSRAALANGSPPITARRCSQMHMFCMMCLSTEKTSINPR